jgi:hypothetical protein
VKVVTTKGFRNCKLTCGFGAGDADTEMTSTAAIASNSEETLILEMTNVLLSEAPLQSKD